MYWYIDYREKEQVYDNECFVCFRWCLFPPETPKELLKPSQGEAWKQKGEAITWFTYVYPKVSQPGWPEKYKMVRDKPAAS